MKGFIKLPREFIEWEWWNRQPHHPLFEWLLVKAQVRDKKVQGIGVRRGSVLTTWNEMQNAVGCSRGALSRALNDLSDSGEITLRTDCRKTIVTICHYEDYNGNAETLWTDSGLIADCQRTDTPIYKGERENEKDIYSAYARGSSDDGFVTDYDCRQWMQRYAAIARTFGVPEKDLPCQLSDTRKRKIAVCVRERGRGSVDAMFARLAESPAYFDQGSHAYRGDFTKLWSPAVFDMVLEGSFVPLAKKKAAQKETASKHPATIDAHITETKTQTREEWMAQMRQRAKEDPKSRAAQVVAQWDKEEQRKGTQQTKPI